MNNGDRLDSLIEAITATTDLKKIQSNLCDALYLLDKRIQAQGKHTTEPTSSAAPTESQAGTKVVTVQEVVGTIMDATGYVMSTRQARKVASMLGITLLD